MKNTVVALFTLCATGMACAQAAGSSKVELWGIVDAPCATPPMKAPIKTASPK